MITSFDKIKEGEVVSGNIYGIIKSMKDNSITIENPYTKSTTVVDVNIFRTDFISSSQYVRRIVVSLEDDTRGNPGIISLLKNIKSGEVFTIVYEDRKEDDCIIEKIKSGLDELLGKIKEYSTEKEIASFYTDKVQSIKDSITTMRSPVRLKEIKGLKTHDPLIDNHIQCIAVEDTNIGYRFNSIILGISANTVHKLIYKGTLYIVEGKDE